MKALLLSLLILAFACNQTPETLPTSEQEREQTAPLADPAVAGNNMHRDFYPNGQVRTEGNMKDGKRHGLWTGYNEQGQVKSRGEFINGVQEGPTVVFHDNGGIYYSGSYKMGKQSGVWKFYDEKGTEVKSIDFDKDPQ